jgi:hypothetical protein
MGQQVLSKYKGEMKQDKKIIYTCNTCKNVSATIQAWNILILDSFCNSTQ